MFVFSEYHSLRDFKLFRKKRAKVKKKAKEANKIMKNLDKWGVISFLAVIVNTH